jgi:uncharacterized protein YdhG (YjbR/CyaY superfamily)
MVQSKAATVEEYLDELPAERRAVLAEVRNVLKQNMPPGFRETVAFGMITYCIPLEKYPNTYNKQPLGYVGLAAQKNYNALYLMRVYGDPVQRQQLEAGFRQAGKKLDMGKSCVRFRKADDLPLDVIGKLVASTSPEAWIDVYERSRTKK